MAQRQSGHDADRPSGRQDHEERSEVLAVDEHLGGGDEDARAHRGDDSQRHHDGLEPDRAPPRAEQRTPAGDADAAGGPDADGRERQGVHRGHPSGERGQGGHEGAGDDDQRDPAQRHGSNR